MKFNINGKEIEVSNDEIKAALEENKDTLELKADLVVRSTEEEEAFKTNIRKEGIASGAEIGRKEVIKGLGIEGEGLHKSDASTIEAISTWGNTLKKSALEEAKIEPNKQLQSLTSDLELLKGTIAAKDEEINKVKNEYIGYKKSNTINSTLSSLIPENVILPKEDMLTLLKTKIKADVHESGKVIALGDDGQPLKDSTTADVLPIDRSVQSFFDNNPQYLKPTQGGAAGGDSGSGGGKQSIDDFIDEMKKANVTPNSESFNAQMQERIKAGTLAV